MNIRNTLFTGVAAIAAIACTAIAKPKPAASPAATAAPNKIKVNVQCVTCHPPTSDTQMAGAVKGGGYTVDAQSAGDYRISYADGPNKGKTIATVSAGAAGPINFGLNGQTTAPTGMKPR